MPNISFFPTDVNQRTVGTKVHMIIYGRTTDGRQIIVIDDNAEPYFYVLPKTDDDLKEKISKLRIEKDEGIYYVSKAEECKKKLNGTLKNIIKVSVNVPNAVSEIANIVKNWEMVDSIYEHDTLFIRKYAIDKNIVFFKLIQAAGDFTNLRAKVPVFRAESFTQLPDTFYEKPRILALDIETYNPEGKQFLPEKYPIIMISFYSEDFQRAITWKRFKTDKSYMEFVSSEAELIERAKAIIDSYKPDILVGFGSDIFDLPYLHIRANKYKIRLDLGSDYSELSVNDMGTKAQINSLLHIDISKFIRKIYSRINELTNFDLYSVAEELLGEKKETVDLSKLVDVWDQKTAELETYCEHNMMDSRLCYDLFKKLYPSLLELVKIIGLSIFDVSRIGLMNQIEWFLIRQAAEFDELVLNKAEKSEMDRRKALSIKTNLSFKTKLGYFKDIATLDYSTQLSSLIAIHNISGATFKCKCCMEKSKRVPQKDYWFCNLKKGFIPLVVDELLSRKRRISDILGEDSSNVQLKERLDVFELLINYFWSYYNFYGARWYSPESVISIIAYADFYINNIAEMAEKRNFIAVYMDPRAIFFQRNDRMKTILDVIELINLNYPEVTEIEEGDYYKSGLFVSPKKYALMTEGNWIFQKGFDTTMCDIVKETQKDVIKLILDNSKIDDIVKLVKETISDLKNNVIGLDKVTIAIQLQKKLEDYDSLGPYVKVAMLMKEQGQRIVPGSNIRYIIVKGPGRIADKARIADDVKQNEYDGDYYVNNQLIPTLEKIFDALGYGKDVFLEQKGQARLGSFIG